MDNPKRKQLDENLAIDGTFPHQITSPDYKQSTCQMQPPFVNKYGVVIGDSFYDSPESPLNQWSTNVDPSVMAGDEWVHPTNDIGWNTSENRENLENIRPKSQFMHPTKDVSYDRD